MRNMAISSKVLNAFVDLATLGGIVLGIDAIAQAVKGGGSLSWAIFGVFVAAVSGLKIADDLFEFFGDWRTHQARRLVGGGMVILMFALTSVLVVRFRF